MSQDASGQERVPRQATDQQGRPEACAGCPQEHACREVWAKSNEGPFTAGGLVLASVVAFLLPLLTAVAGGVLVRAWAPTAAAPWLLAGAAGGLVVGVALARLTMPFLRKHFHDKKSS